ncbi:MAG: beta-propeller fold lactonase family protein [Streptosporangiaceae bacterium]|nr:beta-propeller fold lactonase family protein [Streptosporangiaceae bacterium]
MKSVSHRLERTAVRAQDAGRGARHILKRGRPGALILGLAAAAAVAVPAAASASADTSPVVGHVYVNDNTTGTNTIGAFNRHADGTLSPEAGSPFPAGGAGNGSGLSSQGAIQTTPDGRFLIAVDAGSNQISVLRVHFDGSLSLVSTVGSAARCPTALPCTATWSTWPTPVPAMPTTPASGSASSASYSRSRGRPSRWPPTPRPATCCLTAPAPSWSAPRWAHP